MGISLSAMSPELMYFSFFCDLRGAVIYTKIKSMWFNCFTPHKSRFFCLFFLERDVSPLIIWQFFIIINPQGKYAFEYP